MVTISKYQDLIIEIKKQILISQQKAAFAVNKELILLYWNIGKMIYENQSILIGRNVFIEQLSKDIKSEFPLISGFSRSNLFNIRKFYIFYAINSVQLLDGLKESNNNDSIQQPVGLENILQIPWGHHIIIIEKTKTKEEAFFYIEETIKNNWSKRIYFYRGFTERF